MGEGENTALKLHLDGHLRLEFRGAKVTTYAGLLAVRELDEAMGLTDMAGDFICYARTGRNVRHELAGLLRQSVFARLAGYEDVNGQEALTRDPAMRAGRRKIRRWKETRRALRRYPDSRRRYSPKRRTSKRFLPSTAHGWKRRSRAQRPRR